MKSILKLKSQIKALNNRLNDGKSKNVYAIQNKIKSLKMELKTAEDNMNWERFLSI